MVRKSAKIVIDTRGNDKQKHCINTWANSDTVEDIVYGGSKGSAKSYTGCTCIFGDAFLYPETHYFIARKELNDLRKHTRPSIQEVLGHWGVDSKEYYTYNGQDNVYHLFNGSKVFLLNAKYLPSDPTYARFGSMQMTRGWIEEAGEFERECKNNLKISLGRWKNDVYGLKARLLQTCNPAKNYLYYDYYKPFKDGLLNDYTEFIQALPQDNKMLPDGYYEMLLRTLDENGRQRLLFGNWEYDDDPTKLVEFDAIGDLYSNTHVSADESKKAMTLDVALDGKDSLIMLIWIDKLLVDWVAMDKSSGKDIIQLIANKKAKWGIPESRIVYDADGAGGFIGGANGFFSNAKAFKNGSRPKFVKTGNNNYGHLKDFCAFKLAESINNREYYLLALKGEHKIKERIQAELEQLKELNRDDDKSPRKIIKKDDMKAVLGHSPDWLDALLMREYLDHVKEYDGNADYFNAR